MPQTAFALPLTASVLLFTACGNEYPLAQLYGKTLSLSAVSATGVALTPVDQEVGGFSMRVECPAGFVLKKAAEGARDRDTGQAAIVATVDGALTFVVNDSALDPLPLAIDLQPEGQGQDCGEGCVSWMGLARTTAWISGTAKITGDALEIQDIQSASGEGLGVIASPLVVMHGLTLKK